MFLAKGMSSAMEPHLQAFACRVHSTNTASLRCIEPERAQRSPLQWYAAHLHGRPKALTKAEGSLSIIGAQHRTHATLQSDKSPYCVTERYFADLRGAVQTHAKTGFSGCVVHVDFPQRSFLLPWNFVRTGSSGCVLHWEKFSAAMEEITCYFWHPVREDDSTDVKDQWNPSAATA